MNKVSYRNTTVLLFSPKHHSGTSRTTEERGSIHGRGMSSLFPKHPDRFDAHQASYTMGSGSSFVGEKRPEREADHSPPV